VRKEYSTSVCGGRGLGAASSRRRKSMPADAVREPLARQASVFQGCSITASKATVTEQGGFEILAVSIQCLRHRSRASPQPDLPQEQPRSRARRARFDISTSRPNYRYGKSRIGI
jgi:hypothetical protein